MKNPWISEMVPAFRSLKDLRYIASSVLIEAIFYFIYGVFTAPIYGNIQEYISIAGMHVSQAAKQMTLEAANIGTITPVLFSDLTIRSLFISLLGLFGILFLIGFLLYSIFYGTLFYLSSKQIAQKIQFSRFIQRFSIINLFWSIFIIIRYVFTFFSDLELYFARKSIPDIMLTPLVVVSLVFLLVILYFAFISYGLLGSSSPVRKTFQMGFSQAYFVLPAFLIALFGAWILSMILAFVGEKSSFLLYVLGAFVLLPFLAVMRVYIIRVVTAMQH